MTNPRADYCYFWKYVVPVINDSTESVDKAYFDWQEDMRRWRSAMEEYEMAVRIYNVDNDL